MLTLCVWDRESTKTNITKDLNDFKHGIIIFCWENFFLQFVIEREDIWNMIQLTFSHSMFLNLFSTTKKF